MNRSGSLGDVSAMLWDWLFYNLVPINGHNVWVLAIDMWDALQVQGGLEVVTDHSVHMDSLLLKAAP